MAITKEQVVEFLSNMTLLEAADRLEQLEAEAEAARLRVCLPTVDGSGHVAGQTRAIKGEDPCRK